MRFYVRSVSVSEGSGSLQRGFSFVSAPTTPSINIELTPINGRIDFQSLTELTKMMIVDVTKPEELVVTAEQLQMSMDKDTQLKEKEPAKLNERIDMPDITMCKDEKCTGHKFCYRFMAKPCGHWQSFFAQEMKQDFLVESEKYPGMNVCAYFWPIDGHEDMKKIHAKDKLTISGFRGD